jgi:hypothetical protein
MRNWQVIDGAIEQHLTVHGLPYRSHAFLGASFEESLQETPAIEKFCGLRLQVVAASSVKIAGIPLDKNNVPGKWRQPRCQRRTCDTATDDKQVG